MSKESNSLRPSEYPSREIADLARLQRRLTSVLSAVAGAVDVISFVSLKLFAAHITGNLVVIAALLASGGPPNMDQILAVPVFLVAVAGVWLIARLFEPGHSLVRALLLVHLLLLACVLVYSVISHPDANPRGLASDVTAMIAVSAMACQWGLLRLAVPGAPSTAVMTGNLAKSVVSLLDSLALSERGQDAREQLKSSLELVLPFFTGCLAGAAAFSYLGDWAWSLPVLLAWAGLLLVPGRRD